MTDKKKIFLVNMVLERRLAFDGKCPQHCNGCSSNRIFSWFDRQSNYQKYFIPCASHLSYYLSNDVVWPEIKFPQEKSK